MKSDIYVATSWDECLAFAAEATGRERERGLGLAHLDEREFIEREQAAGQMYGPFHTRWLLRQAPERVRRLLDLGRLYPQLVASNNDWLRPTAQFPPVAMKAAINTTVTETNLWDPGRGPFLVPADTMRAGQRWDIVFGGVMGTTATPTIAWRSRWGTNNAAPPTGTDLGLGPTVTLGTFTAQPFHGHGRWGVRKIDVAASLAALVCTGCVAMPAAAAATVTPVAVFGGALPTTIDQTVAQGVGVSITWGTSSASNTLTPLYADPVIGG